MRTAHLRTAFGWLLAALCLAWALMTFDWQGIALTLRHIHPGLFVATALATLLPFFALRTLRWRGLLPEQRGTVPFLTHFITVGIALGLASLVPLQGAEILKVEAGHADTGLARRRGYAALLIERATDLLFVLMVFCLCYPATLPAQGRLVAFLLLTAATLMCLLTLCLGLLPGTSRFGAWGSLVRSLIESPAQLLTLACTTLGAWLCVLVGWYGVLASLQLHLAPVRFLGFMSGITLLGVLSLVPGGIGICELGITGMLMRAGVPAAAAQGAALLLRCYALASALLALALWLWQRRCWRRPDRTASRTRSSSATGPP